MSRYLVPPEIKESILKEAIDALCFKCERGEERKVWNGDRTHTFEYNNGTNIHLIGHYSCPANPVWRLLGK